MIASANPPPQSIGADGDERLAALRTLPAEVCNG